MNRTNVLANRTSRKWSNRELVVRLLWDFVRPVFRFSPRWCWRWRTALLRLFGARIGERVHIHPSAKVFISWNVSIGEDSSIGFDALIYDLGQVSLGKRVTISQRAHLCAGSHDYGDSAMPLLKLPITIADDVWVCADAFIGPGVTIGEGAVVGARAVVTKDVPPWTVVAGNPATPIKNRKIRETKTDSSE